MAEGQISSSSPPFTFNNDNMKKIISSVLILCTALCVSAYDSYLKVDFSSGNWPESVVRHDGDGLDQSPDNAIYGFGNKDSWIIADVFGNGVPCACATSYFTVPAAASNWIITRALDVTSEKAVFEWTARSGNAKMPDGYSVYVSTTGGSPADFRDTSPLFHIAKEDEGWTRRSITIGEYVGKRIWIAFVHDTFDGDRLCLSNLFAGVPASAYLLCDTPEIVGDLAPLDVTTSVYTTGEEPVKGFSVSLATPDGVVVRQDYPDVELSAGNMVDVTFPKALLPVADETMEYTMTVEAVGDSYEVKRNLTCLPVRVLCEEMTGTWCGFCVCGIVEMEKMRERYPDTFVGAAVHINDVMTSPEWAERVNNFIGEGLPAMVMNHDRVTSGHPRLISDYYKSLIIRKPVASVALDAVYDESTGMVRAETRLLFAENARGEEYRVELGVIENEVCHPGDSRYSQKNYYAENAYGEMGGWENLPETVENVRFNEVGRMYVANTDPLPDEIRSLEPILHSADFQLSSKVENPKNTEVIAILVDKNGKAVNVVKSKLKSDSSVESVEGDGFEIRNGIINLAPGNNQEIRLYGLTGNLLKRSLSGSMDCNGLRGVFILVIGKNARKILL